MNAKDRATLVRKIKSKKAGERRSAAWAMWKSGDASFGPIILESLKNEKLEDATIWESKCLMIAALAGLHYREALPFLGKMVSYDYSEAPIIYRELAMAICLLKPIGPGKMGFVAEAMKSKKLLFVRGAYHAIHHLGLELDEVEITPLIRFAKEYSKRFRDDEEITVMPRDYLAAAAWKWKGKVVRDFLVSCRSTKYRHLQEIASASLKGERSSDSRLRWYV